MDVFFAVSDPTRRKILELLARRGELSATEIYMEFNVSHPAISQHLKILRQAGLVKVEKHAQQRIYKINPQPVLALEDWTKQLTQQWNQRLDLLEEIIKQEKEKTTE
jgi:DNA-binding transcriptional ArsR family regulator